MQSDTLKTKILMCAPVMFFFISNCNKKTGLENQITIKINSINSKTKLPRANAFDTIVLRKEGIGYLMRTFDEVGEYVTDSTGSVKIKVNSTEDYQISLYGVHFYGSENLYGSHLKDGQEVNIEAFSVENR
jgi:hypothetical protein